MATSISWFWKMIFRLHFPACLQARRCWNHSGSFDVVFYYIRPFLVLVLSWDGDHQVFHFKNQDLELLSTSFVGKHNCSSPYVQCSNGTIESCLKPVLRVMRAFSTEFCIPEAEWASTVPAIQSILNNSPSLRLANRAPITVQTVM